MPRSLTRSRTCQECSKNFVLGVDSSQHKYCSVECRRQFHLKQWPSKYSGKNKLSNRAWRLRTKYNLSLDEFETILDDQNGCCPICNIQEPPGYNWHVDHCHKTDKVRGILCARCNQALGLLKENISSMENLIKYVKHHS